MLAGGRDAFAKRVADRQTRQRIEAEMREIFANERGADDRATTARPRASEDRR